jgi:uncharacterized protein (DUF2062 family)
MKILRPFKYYYLKIKRFRGSPQSLASGIAIGVFVGLTPTMPFHTLLILAVCFLTRTSAITAIAVSWFVCNPLTYFPIYYFAAIVGNRVTPYSLQMKEVKILIEQFRLEHSFSEIMTTLFNFGYEAIVVLLVGGLIIAAPCGLLSYYISLAAIRTVREKRAEKKKLL